MAWQAAHKYARISSRKVRLVADMVRGLEVQDAVNVLKCPPPRAAAMISKVLSSAISNADEKEADVDRLIVSEIRVGEGPTIKRFRPKDRGRAHSILKRTSHIIVAVDVV